MVDPTSIVQLIDIAITRCDQIVRAVRSIKKNPRDVENLCHRYARIGQSIRNQALHADAMSQTWRDALAAAEVYFKTSYKELNHLHDALCRRKMYAAQFWSANRIADSIAVLTAGLERLEFQVLSMDGIGHVRADLLQVSGKLDDMCQELGSGLREIIIQHIGRRVRDEKPRTNDDVDRVFHLAAKEGLLAEFDRLASAAPGSSVGDSSLYDTPDATMMVDEYTLEQIIRGRDRNVEVVATSIRTGDMVPEVVKRDIEKLIERLWEPWKVNPKDIVFSRTTDMFGESIKQELGRGATGAVYKASMAVPVKGTSDKQPTDVAVKMLDRVLVQDSLKADFLREVELLSALQHPCIVRFHGAFWPNIEEENKAALVVMELMGGNAASLLQEDHLLVSADVLRVLLDVADGLEYLHECGIVHMDVKPANVLVNTDELGRLSGRAKLADFGVSQKKRLISTNARPVSPLAVGGTLMYMAPELIVGHEKARESCDVWSYGVMLCELLLPVDLARGLTGLTDREITMHASTGRLYGIVQELANKIDDALLRDLAVSCLSKEPEQRPNFRKIRLTMIISSLGLGGEWVKRLNGRDADSMFHIGLQHFFGVGTSRNVSDALTWLRVAEMSGSVDAEHMIGVCFAASSSQSWNAHAIACTMEQASTSSDPRDFYLMGWLHMLGFGVPLDLVKALTMYQRAADLGHTPSQVRLGLFYENGLRMTRITTEVAGQLQRADEMRVPGPQSRLQRFRGTGAQCASSMPKAIELYRRGADAGNSEALFNLGVCHFLGLGVASDLDRALALYTAAADAGHAGAEFSLGVCYANGDGLEKDSAMAFSLYRRAAEAGHTAAKFNLGSCFENGVGVEKDPTAAVAMYKRAADAGSPDALFRLAVFYRMGFVVQENVSEAIRFYESAAAAGHAGAQNNLGFCYQHGVGVATDLTKAFASYECAADAGHADAQFNLGVCYQNGIGVQKDQVKGVTLLQRIADAGHVGAQSNLANCHRHGLGVQKDTGKAVALYMLAAGAGNADAQFQLGTCYYNGLEVAKNEARAVELYRQAADAGHVEAQFHLGRCYCSGVGVETDSVTGVELYKRASDAGLTAAQFSLGLCHSQGVGVAKDAATAVELFRRAANDGNADAMTKLAHFYRHGLGVPVDVDKAFRLYSSAGEAGNADALYNLGVCYGNGIGVERNSMMAASHYRRAAEAGHVGAQDSLGMCYERGTGVDRDPFKAANWYKRAAAAGNADAQDHLGSCYLNGIGVVKDVEKAVEQYERAAEAEHAGAQYHLGQCYLNGNGVGRDLAKEISLNRRAAKTGHPKAIFNLAVSYEVGAGVPREPERAVSLYREASDAGHAPAMFHLGQCYQFGIGVRKDASQAFALYRKAADAGDTKAQKKVNTWRARRNGSGSVGSSDRAG